MELEVEASRQRIGDVGGEVSVYSKFLCLALML